jgi:hypothetical protein
MASTVHALNQRWPSIGGIVDLALAVVVASDEESGLLDRSS